MFASTKYPKYLNLRLKDDLFNKSKNTFKIPGFEKDLKAYFLILDYLWVLIIQNMLMQKKNMKTDIGYPIYPQLFVLYVTRCYSRIFNVFQLFPSNFHNRCSDDCDECRFYR